MKLRKLTPTGEKLVGKARWPKDSTRSKKHRIVIPVPYVVGVKIYSVTLWSVAPIVCRLVIRQRGIRAGEALNKRRPNKNQRFLKDDEIKVRL